MRWELSLLKSRLKHIIKSPLYDFYEGRLSKELHKAPALPKHIGLILDGNRRFAKEKRFQKAVEGHAAGADKVRELIFWCEEFDIPVITLWIFSLDNFSRSEDEVNGLFRLIERKTRELCTDPLIYDKQVRLKYMGRTSLLPDSLQESIREAEKATESHQRFQLNIAVAYGGREEIADAFRSYIEAAHKEGKPLDTIAQHFTPDSLEPYLYTSGLPEPDLIIRTSGEIRLSGFLLWQSAYAEYYFSDVLWPEFRKIDFLRALRVYTRRQRRFGK